MVAAFGATAGAALITVSRAELTRAVSRRLRGAAPSLAWLSQVDNYLTAASATTSLGVLLVGAALPGARGLGRAAGVVVALAILGVPLVLFAAYLVPRWLTQPRAETRGGPRHPGAAAVVAGRRPAAARPHRHAARPTCARSGARAPRSVSGPTTSCCSSAG